jgi:NlpC/P60 family
MAARVLAAIDRMNARVERLVEDYNEVREALARTRVEQLRRQVEALAAKLADQAERKQRLQARLAARRRQIEARLAAQRRYHQRLTRQVRRAVAEERRRRRRCGAGPCSAGWPPTATPGCGCQGSAGSSGTPAPHVGLGGMAPGDLVFFAYNVGNPSTIHHVGMYVGGGAMVEAPYSGARVRIASIGRHDYIGAVRPTG